MDSLYSELSEYFVFDKQKYSLEEFFGDIKLFKDKFKQVRFCAYCLTKGQKMSTEVCLHTFQPLPTHHVPKFFEHFQMTYKIEILT